MIESSSHSEVVVIQAREALIVEAELSCAECGHKAVEAFEVLGFEDGYGFIECPECGDPTPIEVE